jgi:hypothetical protein
MNFADAVEQVLKANGAPLPVAEITRRAVDRGLISPRSDQPAAYVGAAIRKDNRHREQQGKPARFSRTSPGTYGLS